MGPGNLEILDTKKNQKKYQNKIKISVAQIVGKVWISRGKILLAPFGANFSMDRKNANKLSIFVLEYIFLGGPMGPIFLDGQKGSPRSRPAVVSVYG